MLQRVQSLYLIGVILCQVLIAFLPLISFTSKGTLYKLTSTGIFNELGEKSEGTFAPLILVALAIIAAVITIALFKDRKKQMKVAQLILFVCVAQLLFIGTGVYQIQAELDTEISFGFASFLIPICGILSQMAKRAIKKDDDLVRSVDRIR